MCTACPYISFKITRYWELKNSYVGHRYDDGKLGQHSFLDRQYTIPEMKENMLATVIDTHNYVHWRKELYISFPGLVERLEHNTTKFSYA